MVYVIQLNDGDPPLRYWSDSPKIHPAGNWGEKTDAKLFAQDRLAQQYINSHLSHQAELCKVVPL